MTLSLYSASKSTAAVVVLLGSLLGACCVECQPLAVGYQRVVKLAEESVATQTDSKGSDYGILVDNSYSWQWNAEAGWRPRGRRQRRGAGSPNVAFLADTDRAEDGGGYGSRRLGWDGDGRGEEEGYLSQKGGERALTARGIEAEAGASQHQHWRRRQQEVDWDRVNDDRKYLNGLVEASVLKTKEQACNVAFAKTHKTASTTLAMILVRYARRHEKTLASFTGKHVSAIPLEEAAYQIKYVDDRVDVMHYHFTSSGDFRGHWEKAKVLYEQIMRDDERVNYLTVLRSPREHFLSYYYYFIQPEVSLSIQHFYSSKRKDRKFEMFRKRLENPLCLEFGIRSEKDLEEFVAEQLPDFRLALLTEKFDEGLMVMRRLFNWDLIDLTYARMMQTKSGMRRWDGKVLKDVPNFDNLPKWVQDVIDEKTNMDRVLYAAAEAQYAQELALVADEVAGDLVEFSRLQKIMGQYLERNTTSEARAWYDSAVQPYRGGPPFHPF